MRPKDVLLKYKELIREASRDEITLINLENQLRIVELEEAKKTDSWKMITNPTVLNYSVAPSRSKISFIGLFIGLIGSSIIVFLKEKRSERIYDSNLLENLLSIPIIENFAIKDDEFINENIRFIK